MHRQSFIDYGAAGLLYTLHQREIGCIPMHKSGERFNAKQRHKGQQVQRASAELLGRFIELKDEKGNWVLAKCVDIEEGGEATCFAMKILIYSSDHLPKCEMRHVYPHTEIRVGSRA